MTLHDLQTVYSLEDLHNLLEIGMVNAHNARVLAKRQQEAMKRLAQMQGG